MPPPRQGPESPRRRVFRGWAVVAGVFSLMAIASGLGLYNASAYLEVVVSERGIPIAAASGASATFSVVSLVATSLLVVALRARTREGLLIRAGSCAFSRPGRTGSPSARARGRRDAGR